MFRVTTSLSLSFRSYKSVKRTSQAWKTRSSLTKLAYLAVEEAARKWTMRHGDWAMIYSQLMIFFEDRLEKYV